MMSHAEVNDRANQLFKSGLRGELLEKRIATLRQWQRMGLEASTVDHLIMAVPTQFKVRSAGR